jgi:nitronate monooxygenase
MFHRDEARWCAMLLKQLKALGVPASNRIGAFEEKALAIDALPERIAFLNRGQGWVVKKSARACCPRCADDSTASRSYPRCWPATKYQLRARPTTL